MRTGLRSMYVLRMPAWFRRPLVSGTHLVCINGGLVSVNRPNAYPNLRAGRDAVPVCGAGYRHRRDSWGGRWHQSVLRCETSQDRKSGLKGLSSLSLSLIWDTYNPISLPRLPPLSLARSVLSYLERRNARPASRLSQADEQPHLDTLIVSILCFCSIRNRDARQYCFCLCDCIHTLLHGASRSSYSPRLALIFPHHGRKRRRGY